MFAESLAYNIVEDALFEGIVVEVLLSQDNLRACLYQDFFSNVK